MDFDEIYGGEGSDSGTFMAPDHVGHIITYAGGLFGGGGFDEIYGGGGDDFCSGGLEGDILEGGSGNDVLMGDDGDDQLYGGEDSGGGDRLEGGNGDDFLSGGQGFDEIYGGPDSDDIDGGGVDDLVYGGDGDDVITESGYGDDVCFGGSGADVIAGGLWIDHLEGGTGDDEIYGGKHPDSILEGVDGGIYGGSGDDILYGGSGADTLNGGSGSDVMFGGGGADTFDFDAADMIPESVDDRVSPAFGGPADEVAKVKPVDTVHDFSKKDGDVIDLKGVDAQKSRPGNQKFKYIGASGFNSEKGELRFEKDKVSGDVNGDGKADFVIFVDANKLGSGDFVL